MDEASRNPSVPALLIGAGRLGGALIDGWLLAKAFAPGELLVCARTVTAAASRARGAGAVLDPAPAELATARTVILAVKPQAWRQAAQAYARHLHPDAVVVSLLVGVPLADIAAGFAGRSSGRAMPTTAVAIARGVTTLFAPDAEVRARATGAFAPVSTLVEIADEALIYPATAVSGSAPGYLYAFVEALEAAGIEAGLSPEQAAALVRGAIAGAAELMARTVAAPADLRRQVASPGGTTHAALEVMAGGVGGVGGLDAMMRGAVAANIARARELAV